MSTPASNVKSFYKGQTIFKEGQESNVAYMIKKGGVNISRVINNKKVILGRLGEGEIFGEMGVIAGTPRTADAEAAEFCELLVLTDQIMSSLLRQCPKTIQLLTKLLIRRLSKANAMVPDSGHASTFMSVCRILDLAWRNHQRMTKEELQKEPNAAMGLSVQKFSRTVRDIILISQLEIDNVIRKLKTLKVVEVSEVKSSAAFPDRHLKVADADHFLELAENLYAELQKSDFSSTAQMQWMDIYEVAEAVEADPQVLYAKLAAHEIPETLFFFERTNLLEWAAKQGPDFFRKAGKRRKSLDELSEIDDLVFVDGGTLKEVLVKLGYYKVGVLLSASGEEAGKKVRSCLAPKVLQAVAEEAKSRSPATQAEVEDLRDELFSMIHQMKGAPSK